MKRVKAACILQTLVFFQNPRLGYDKKTSLSLNLKEFDYYKFRLERSKTRYQIDSFDEQEDGTIVVRMRKQYNEKVIVSEYFN